MLPKHPVWTLIGVIVGWFIVHLILTQVGELGKMFDAIGEADPGWLIAAILAMTVTHVGAGIAQMGSVNQNLPFVRTVLVQLAGAAANRLTPAGVGGMGVSVRYLQKRGISTADAFGAVGLDSAAGIVVHTVSLVVAATAVHGRGVTPNLKVPTGWPELLALGVVAAALGVALWMPSVRHRLAPVGDVMRNLGHVVRRPLRALQLFGGSMLITGGNVVALYLALRSVGVHGSVVTVAAVYLIGSAVASAAPTPGGLGAVEAALVAGLTAVHVPVNLAVPAVLIYRLVTFWLPILPGWPLIRALRRREVL